MMLQAPRVEMRPRKQTSIATELELKDSERDSDIASTGLSLSESVASSVDVQSPEDPSLVIDQDVLRLADASRADAAGANQILQIEQIARIQSAILQRMANQLSEQELLQLYDDTIRNEPLQCWCCNELTPSPPMPVPDSVVSPIFVISAIPEWLLPALHCSNLECPGRRLGLQVKPKYGDGISFEHAGLLVALYIQRKWRPLSWFLTRDESYADPITEVNYGLTLRRAALAILLRIFKPYDDFIQDCERQQVSKGSDKTAKTTLEDRSNQENECGNPSPNVPDRPLRPEDEMASIPKAKAKRIAFEECRRSMQVEELDGCAKILWSGSEAAGFCTFSVRMDANYGVYAMLNGIYVRRCFRRQGLAREAIRNFFRVVAPAICQKKNPDSEVLMAIQAPVTRLILIVLKSSLEPKEMARIKCVRAQCPLALCASVRSWVAMDSIQ